MRALTAVFIFKKASNYSGKFTYVSFVCLAVWRESTPEEACRWHTDLDRQHLDV